MSLEKNKTKTSYPILRSIFLSFYSQKIFELDRKRGQVPREIDADTPLRKYNFSMHTFATCYEKRTLFYIMGCGESGQWAVAGGIYPIVDARTSVSFKGY